MQAASSYGCETMPAASCSGAPALWRYSPRTVNGMLATVVVGARPRDRCDDWPSATLVPIVALNSAVARLRGLAPAN